MNSEKESKNREWNEATDFSIAAIGTFIRFYCFFFQVTQFWTRSLTIQFTVSLFFNFLLYIESTTMCFFTSFKCQSYAVLHVWYSRAMHKS